MYTLEVSGDKPLPKVLREDPFTQVQEAYRSINVPQCGYCK